MSSKALTFGHPVPLQDSFVNCGVGGLCNCIVTVLQELERGTIERCRGFAEHLSVELIKQRKWLAAYTDNFVVFR